MVAVSPARAAVLFAGLAAACHALLPLTDYVSFDDKYIVSWVNRADYDSLYTMYAMCGGQLCYAYFSALAGYGDVVPAFKIAGVLFAVATGWLAWRVGTASRFLTSAEALLVGAVAVVIPAYKFKGGLVYSIYDWAPAVFLLGTWLALLAENRRGFGHVGFRAGALAAFLASFLMPSILAFYGGFFLLLVLAHWRDTGRRWYAPPIGFGLRRLDYLLLPFAFWVAKNHFFPTNGVYETYNRVGLTRAAAEKSVYGTGAVLADPVTLCCGLPWPFLAGVVGVAVVGSLVIARALRTRPGEPSEPVFGSGAGPCALVAFGLVLLVLGLLPYAAVGKPPRPTGVPASYTPLIPLPVGIIVVGVLKGVARVGRVPSVGVTAALALYGACGVAGWWHNYLTMQAVEARNRSILHRRDANPAARRCTVYCIVNRYRIARAPDQTHTWQWVYLETGRMAAPRSFGFYDLPNIPSVPVPIIRDAIAETTLGYSMSAIDQTGPQGLLLIFPNNTYTPPQLGWKYLWTKYARPDRLDALLDRLTDVRFFPVPWDTVAIAREAGPAPPP